MIAARYLLLLLATLAALACRADNTWVWAWDRPEDLRWLPPGVGVAWFAAQFDAQDARFQVRPRRAVLKLRPDTPLLPVLHIEAFHPRRPAALGPEAVTLWANALAHHAALLDKPEAPLRRLQIDFEARKGQQDFYLAVLRTLRAKLPPTTWLSVTALASWCGDEAWLRSLPVDEVVPMYFRMGPAERGLWQQRMLTPDQLPERCRQAAGLATDEWQIQAASLGHQPLAAFADRQLYLFAPRRWQPETLSSLPGWSNHHIKTP